MEQLKDIINLDLKITDPPEAEPPLKTVIKEINSETGEVNPNFVYEDEPHEQDIDLPEFKPKPSPDKDIFMEDQPPVPKPREAPQVKVIHEGKPVKLNKNGKPRKKMSPEHLEKLKVAREKAAAKKRFLKEERLKVKKEKDDIKQKKESLLKENEQLDVSDLEEQVKQKKKLIETPPSPLPVQLPKVEYPPITIDDIQQASLNAVLKVEALRKERKAEKKKKAQIDQYNNETLHTLNKMEKSSPSWYIHNSPYNNCF